MIYNIRYAREERNKKAAATPDNAAAATQNEK